MNTRIGVIDFIQTMEMVYIDLSISVLEDQLNDMRFKKSRGCDVRLPFNDESRALCVKIEKLEKKYYRLSSLVNKEWHDQQPLWKK